MREFCGHGIGRQFHEEPQVLHYGRPGTGLKLQPGMIFTIEPMINAGRPGIRCLADGWTIVTADHSLSAQWEHTVLVTPEGYEVLTRVRRHRRRPRRSPRLTRRPRDGNTAAPVAPRRADRRRGRRAAASPSGAASCASRARRCATRSSPRPTRRGSCASTRASSIA